MRHKLAYTARENANNNDYSKHEKVSPRKMNLYESANLAQDVAFRGAHQDGTQVLEFGGIKKIPEETQYMRQTMNSKLLKRVSSLNLDKSTELPNKFDDFLRQTMSYTSLKNYRRKMTEESPSGSKQIHMRHNYNNQNTQNYHHRRLATEQTMVKVKSTGNLLETANKKKEYDLLTRRIDRNKKVIEELKKTVKEDDNYLRNVNHSKSPAYINLDKQKQTEPVNFRKAKRGEEPELVVTPRRAKNLDRSGHKQMVEMSKSTEKRLETQTMISSRSSVSYARKKQRNFHLKEEFEQGKRLGQGKFGVVNLARHKRTSGVFALKKVAKAMIKSHMMVDQMALELRLQSCLNHRNILAMYGFFDDKTHLYIVLEYMDGGTLFQSLRKQSKLSTKLTAFVIKQIIEGVEYLHDRGIVHRDIKPENIVVSNNVYKLCDFGWAALCNQRRKTYCGTFDYVPPEILEGVDYDMTVDLWCLGVMTFELLTGKAPFYHASRKETMKRIMNVEHDNLVFPEEMSELAKDFIYNLVQKNPNKRMKASQALKHPFLQNAELDL